uniref:Uncharacterized protein n=1 Tax=Arundo donax TaxID=35708 RepID=A0A0A9FYF8_ARUDO
MLQKEIPFLTTTHNAEVQRDHGNMLKPCCMPI